MFLGVLVANVAIGTFQEIRAKRALDKLAALVAPQATVVRDGTPREVPVDEVVVGDLVRVDGRRSGRRGRHAGARARVWRWTSRT